MDITIEMQQTVMQNFTYDDNGELHSEDGPAGWMCDEWPVWYLNGEMHEYKDWIMRVPNNISKSWIEFNSNANIHHEDSDGYSMWQRNMLFHRLDGPALIEHGHCEKWFLMGVLHRSNGPAVIDYSGKLTWMRHGEYHRDDGPAIIYPCGRKEWYQHGKLHRDDGPAYISSGGNLKRWYHHGKIIKSEYEGKLSNLVVNHTDVSPSPKWYTKLLNLLFPKLCK